MISYQKFVYQLYMIPYQKFVYQLYMTNSENKNSNKKLTNYEIRLKRTIKNRIKNKNLKQEYDNKNFEDFSRDLANELNKVRGNENQINLNKNNRINFKNNKNGKNKKNNKKNKNNVNQNNKPINNHKNIFTPKFKNKKIQLSAIDGYKNIIFGITTYNRIDYLKSLLSTFIETKNDNYNWTVIIADDGSVDGTLEYLESLFIPKVDLIVIKNNRCHIARQTNSILEVCTDLNYDFGFMVDDDIYFTDYGWDNDYINASKEHNIEHLVFFNELHCSRLSKSHILNENDNNLGLISAKISAKHCMGCFWTFTPSIIEKVGFFDEINFKGSGFSHQEFTIRCCNAKFNNLETLYDTINSNKKIALRSKATDSNYYTMKENFETNNRRKLEDVITDSSIIKKEHIIKAKNIIVRTNNKINLNPINNVKFLETKILTIIPVYGRHEILKYVIMALEKQTIKTDILLIISNEDDKNFAKCLNINYIEFPNNPLSAKMQSGYDYAKKYNYDYVCLVGSDDLLSEEWIEESLNIIIIDDCDIVGKNYHYLYDMINDSKFIRGYIPANLNYIPQDIREFWSLGSGRFIRKRILNKIDWKLMNKDLNSGLDKESGLCLHKGGAKFSLLRYSDFISVRDDWDCITDLENMKKNHCNFIKPVNSLNSKLFNFIIKYSAHKKNILNFKEKIIILNKIDCNLDFYSLSFCNNFIKHLDEFGVIFYEEINCFEKFIKDNFYIGCIFTTKFSKEDIDIIELFGKCGLPIITNKRLCYPHTIYCVSGKMASYYCKFVFKNYQRYTNKIFKSFSKHKKGKDRIKNICYVPVYFRHDILKKTINCLKNQTVPINILAVVSNEEDDRYCSDILNVDTIFVENLPLGRKYQMGMDFCKIYYPKNVIIVGSDDLLVENYVEKIEPYLENYDIVGNKEWIMHDSITNMTFKCTYIHKINNSGMWGINGELLKIYKFGKPGIPINKSPNNPYSIGAGRTISSKFLDKIGWKVYPTTKNNRLDSFSLYFMIMSGGKNFVYEGEPHVVCYKEDINMINTIDKIKNSADIKIFECKKPENIKMLC